MTFDWAAFLDQNRIEYATSGANVSQGNIALHCPFCGDEDESQHLSVSLQGKGWSCWRNVTHRGKNPTRLVAALLSCSYERARQLTDDNTFLPEDFLGRVTDLMSPRPVVPLPTLELLPSFKPLSDLPTCQSFLRYLQRRGFPVDHPEQLTKRYGLHYCLRDQFTRRIIFPVHVGGQLVTWTGRTIYPDVQPRYKTLTVDAERAAANDLPVAHLRITDAVLWFDDLLRSSRRRALYLTEGPMDALKVRVLGRPHGIEATCLFTNRISDRQVELLHQLVPLFDEAFVLLDASALPAAMRVSDALAGLRVPVKQLPASIKDPGDLKDISTIAQL